ncbi:hypothetical protein XELAEV_18011626mg, partial [Xenopus laevis]
MCSRGPGPTSKRTPRLPGVVKNRQVRSGTKVTKTNSLISQQHSALPCIAFICFLARLQLPTLGDLKKKTLKMVYIYIQPKRKVK